MRVNKNNPCAQCGKPDWCSYTETVACCMRVQSGKPMKNGGWLHKLTEDRVKPYVAPPRPVIREETIDFPSLMEKYRKNTTPNSLVIFGEKLGLDPMSLLMIGCSWSIEHQAWAFPMKNEDQKVIGIRLRNDIGQKWAVKGSRSGLFIPSHFVTLEHLYVVEGPTDACAGLCLGLNVIGRPSCLGCEDLILKFISKNKIKRVVLIADNDEAGITGAKKLKDQIQVPSCMITLPSKDLREFMNMGGNRSTIESILKNRIWKK